MGGGKTNLRFMDTLGQPPSISACPVVREKPATLKKRTLRASTFEKEVPVLPVGSDLPTPMRIPGSLRGNPIFPKPLNVLGWDPENHGDSIGAWWKLS